jgi:hypothetical protein
MTEKVTTAGSGNRAFAADSSGSILLPSSNTVLIGTKVNPSTLYRFSTGIHTNTNVADGASRYGTIELNNDGVKAAWSYLGSTQTSTLCGSPCVSTGTTYYLQLVMQNGQNAAAYAYLNDGGGTTPPTYLGKASFTPGTSSWSGSMNIGTGVWTDSGSNPLSNYVVSEYHDRRK